MENVRLTVLIEKLPGILAISKHLFRRWAKDCYHLSEMMTVRRLFIGIASVEKVSLLE